MFLNNIFMSSVKFFVILCAFDIFKIFYHKPIQYYFQYGFINVLN